ncbi:MAG: hypothetical protein K1X94_34670, partial [Sandaracinaceae bacterium]|nr:hypothetical protein [Sandaracinaceae bacterium]
MSDTRDRDDGPTDEGESLVPRSGRKRRGLRVPVDDVPRQSFVDVARPPTRDSRESAVGRDPIRASLEAAPAAATPSPAPSAAATPGEAPAGRQRMPSVELTLDAELEVEPPPPPRPRPCRPPPPPPTREAAPSPSRDAAPPPDALDEGRLTLETAAVPSL